MIPATRQHSAHEVQLLSDENRLLQQRIAASEKQHNNVVIKLKTNMSKFKQQNILGLKTVTEQLTKQATESSGLIKELTVKYEAVLRQQLQSLNRHKVLAKQKHDMEKLYSAKMDELSVRYENKMTQFEEQIKDNMERIAVYQGTGLMKRLLKIDRFREEMTRLGSNPDIALKEIEVESLKSQIESKDKEMELMEKSNALIDRDVQTLSKQMVQFKELLEGMGKERALLRSQNTEIEERLKKAREMMKSIMIMRGNLPNQQST